MPCYDSRDSDVRADLEQRLDTVTRVACELAGLVVTLSAYTLTKETYDWIKEHKAFDRKVGR